jgi:hypothetical protein
MNIARIVVLDYRGWPARVTDLFVLALGAYRQQQSASAPVFSKGDVKISAFGGFNVGQNFTRLSTTAFRAGLTPSEIPEPFHSPTEGHDDENRREK